jgi:glycosyltransferase involved in cell wall biosynthesis
MGVNVALVCGGQNPDLPIRIPDGVTVDDLGIADRHLAFGITRLAAMLRARQPDVLFAHLNGPARASILARAVSRVPTCIVVVEHTHYSTFGWDHQWLRDQLTSLLYPWADRIAGVSPAVVQDLADHFPSIRGGTVVLPAVGPDPDKLASLSREPPDHPWFRGPDRPMVITSVGNLVPRKGQDTLVEALPLVRAALGDVRLVLVGRFDDRHFLARLQRLAAELGVADSISLEGYRADPLPYIAHSDVFAHASLTEGFAQVLAEAMAFGTPVVATDSPGGASYVLDGGRAGVLVPMRDSSEMARAIVNVLRDSHFRDGLIAAGRRRARQFSPRTVAEAYRAVAQDCLDRRRSTHLPQRGNTV